MTELTAWQLYDLLNRPRPLWLAGCDLSGAYLKGANLSGADLQECNLTGANLSGADLSLANLTGANLTGAAIGGASVVLTVLSVVLWHVDRHPRGGMVALPVTFMWACAAGVAGAYAGLAATGEGVAFLLPEALTEIVVLVPVLGLALAGRAIECPGDGLVFGAAAGLGSGSVVATCPTPVGPLEAVAGGAG